MSRERTPLFWHGTVRRELEGAADLGEFFGRLEVGAGAHDLGDDSIYLCEELVRTQSFLGTRQQRALAVLVLASFVAGRQGSTRLPLDVDQKGYLAALVATLVRAAKIDVRVPSLLRDIDKLIRETSFDTLIGEPGRALPFIRAHGCLYQEQHFARETRLVAHLAPRLAAKAEPVPPEIIDAVDDVVARPSEHGSVRIVLTGEQRAAVTAALSRPLTAIAGGPGTGKTAIVTAIVRSARRLGVRDIALAAPTGKAAQRIADAVTSGLRQVADPGEVDRALLAEPPAAETLHRLLGYLPRVGQFRHHENNPLAADLVLVDEASMIDLVLMERLVRSVRPDARLVLLGDPEQLPSVDAGAVFRDLVTVDGACVTLTESHRMNPTDPDGRAILLAARAVGGGHAAELFGSPGLIKRSSRLEALDERGVSLFETRAGGRRSRDFVADWYRRKLAGHPDFFRTLGTTYRRQGGRFDDADSAELDALFSIYDRARLLTVTRRGAEGSEAVNRQLHELLFRDTSTLSSRPDFLPGDAVMMRVNDYRRGLFNGDQGLVVRVSDDGAEHRFRVVFRRAGVWTVFHLDALRAQIEHAAAMTVHKSQGSEYDHVAILLPGADLPLLSRELLYTAMTRARKSVTLVGTAALVKAGTRRAIQRFSGVAELLG